VAGDADALPEAGGGEDFAGLVGAACGGVDATQGLVVDDDREAWRVGSTAENVVEAREGDAVRSGEGSRLLAPGVTSADALSGGGI
jgi:hypothetical protein